MSHPFFFSVNHTNIENTNVSSVLRLAVIIRRGSSDLVFVDQVRPVFFFLFNRKNSGRSLVIFPVLL